MNRIELALQRGQGAGAQTARAVHARRSAGGDQTRVAIFHGHVRQGFRGRRQLLDHLDQAVHGAEGDDAANQTRPKMRTHQTNRLGVHGERLAGPRPGQGVAHFHPIHRQIGIVRVAQAHLGRKAGQGQVLKLDRRRRRAVFGQPLPRQRDGDRLAREISRHGDDHDHDGHRAGGKGAASSHASDGPSCHRLSSAGERRDRALV